MKTIKVWDLVVRIFHWTLVAAIVSQLVTAENIKSVHITVGYFILALLILRIIWGFIGSRYARFRDFLYPATDILTYLKGLIRGRAKHYISHNPAGGAMAFALIFTLVLTTSTGLVAYGAGGKFWKEIHELFVGIVIFLAVVHFCGVIASSYVHKENLIMSMFTGNRKVKQD
jgi:cytochrome b